MNTVPFRLLCAAGFCAVILQFDACTTARVSMRPDIVQVSAESMQNGHLIEIRTGHPIGDATALLTPDRWIIVTLVDSLLNAEELGSFRASFIDSVEVARFPSSLQIAFRVKHSVVSIELIHDNPSSLVQVSLFTGQRPPPRPNNR